MALKINSEPTKTKPKPAMLKLGKKPEPTIPREKVVVEKTSTNDGLPTEATDQSVSMNSLRWLFVAPPGFGKTELFSLWPNSIMLACEEGHKFVSGYKMIIDTWEGKDEAKDDDGNIHVSFCEAVRRLERSERFTFVQLDTLDALIKKCIDHHVGKSNQNHLSDLGEFGKGYDMGQNDPIRKELNKIFASGRGMGLITHQLVETKKFKAGDKAKKETTLPPGIFKLIYPQMDIIIHGEYGGVRDGQKHRDRILKSEGSEDILAKNRGGILPPAWICPLDKQKRIDQIQGFFTGDEKERKKNVDAAYKEYLTYYQE